jgi:uncharacterized protein YraI
VKRLLFITLVAFMIIPFGLSLPKAQAGDDPDDVLWYSQYYDNAYFLNSPVLLGQNHGIDFNFGSGAPADGLPSDNFSVRWWSFPTFDAGLYRFTVVADDEVTVTLDFDNIVVSTLSIPTTGQTLTYDVTMTAGQHYMQVDYQEFFLTAFVSVTWQKIDVASSQVPPLPTDYPAAYVRTTLNLREGAGVGFAVISKLPQYTVVELLGRNGNGTWVRVRLANGVMGWVSSYYLTSNVAYLSLPLTDLAGNVAAPLPAPPAGAISGAVIGRFVNVRGGPGTDFRVLMIAVRGQVFTVIARTESGGWVKVQLADGVTGWVTTSFLDINGNIDNLPVAID